MSQIKQLVDAGNAGFSSKDVLIVGEASAEQVAEVIDRLWGGEETLIVVSSDLSHYLAYDAAKARTGSGAKVDAGTGVDVGADSWMFTPVLVYAPDQADLFARICGYFDRAGFSILDARVHTAHNGHALDTFQVVASSQPGAYRELIHMVENDLLRAIEDPRPLPEPTRKRVSRRVKSFPIAPRVTLRPDEKAQRWLISISASDRAGLLYLVARVLSRHGLSVQLAKVSTLGERVEDVFLVQGPEMQNNARQIQIETELLQALADQ